MSAHNLNQKSTGKGWEHSEPNESDEPIQEVSWYDIPGVPHEPDQSGKFEKEVPVQEVSWYAIPGVLKMKLLLIPLIQAMPKPNLVRVPNPVNKLLGRAQLLL